jgi:hypothetical protein
MDALATFFSGHPARIAAAGAVAILAVTLAWYLGSPLFTRTYVNEAFPTVAPAATATAVATTVAASALPTGPRVIRSGELNFVDSIHNGKGPVRLVELGAQRLLRFEDVAITNAPDVHVYLSRENGGKWSEETSLYLGPLRATNGSFNYELPADSDIAQYQSVVVWCRAFRVLITWADLRAG